MRYRIKKNKEDKEQSERAKIQQQIDGNAQNEQQKHANEMQRIGAEGEIDMNEEMIRGTIKEKESKRDIIREMYKDLRDAANAEEGITTKKL